MLAGGFGLVCLAHLSLCGASLLVRFQLTRPVLTRISLIDILLFSMGNCKSKGLAGVQHRLGNEMIITKRFNRINI